MSNIRKNDKGEIKPLVPNNLFLKDSKILSKKEYICEKITPDGNCFYRSLSYFYRKDEKDYNEFMQLIISYIEQNIANYFKFISDMHLVREDLENSSESDILQKKIILTEISK